MSELIHAEFEGKTLPNESYTYTERTVVKRILRNRMPVCG
jgi:hypothetical protein